MPQRALCSWVAREDVSLVEAEPVNTVWVAPTVDVGRC